MSINRDFDITNAYTEQQLTEAGFGMPKAEGQTTQGGKITKLFVDTQGFSSQLTPVAHLNKTIQIMDKLVQKELDIQELDKADLATLAMYEKRCNCVLINIKTHETMVNQISPDLTPPKIDQPLSSHNQEKDKVIDHLRKIKEARQTIINEVVAEKEREIFFKVTAPILPLITDRKALASIYKKLNSGSEPERKDIIDKAISLSEGITDINDIAFIIEYMPKTEKSRDAIVKAAAPLMHETMNGFVRGIILWALRELEPSHWESFSKALPPLFKVITDENAITACLKALLRVRVEEMGNVAKIAAGILKDVTNVNVIQGTIIGLASIKKEDRPSVAKLASSFLKGIKEEKTASRLFVNLANIKKENERESVVKYALSMLKDFPDENVIVPIIVGLGNIEERKRESIAKFDPSLLKELKDPNVIANFYYYLVKYVNEDERESVAKYAIIALKDVTDLNVIEGTIKGLASIKEKDRPSVAKFAPLLLRGIKDANVISEMYTTLAKKQLNERESISNSVAPLLRGITNSYVLYAVMKIVTEIEGDDRENFSNFVIHFLNEKIEYDDTKFTIIKALAKVKAEDRQSFFYHSSSLLKGVKNIYNQVRIITLLTEVQSKDWDSFIQYTAKLSQVITHEDDLPALIGPLVKEKSEDRESVFKFVLSFLNRFRDNRSISNLSDFLYFSKENSLKKMSEYGTFFLEDTDSPEEGTDLLKKFSKMDKDNIPDMESFSKMMTPILEGITDSHDRFTAQSFMLFSLQPVDRVSVSNFLSRITVLNVRLSVMKALMGLHNTRYLKHLDSILKYISPYLQTITNSQTLASMIISLQDDISEDDRESVLECAFPILKESANNSDAVGAILQGVARVKKTDRKAVAASFAAIIPFIGNSRNVIENIFYHLSDFNAEKIEGFSDFIRTYLYENITPESLYTIINSLKKIKVEQREGFREIIATFMHELSNKSFTKNIIAAIANLEPSVMANFSKYALQLMQEGKDDEAKLAILENLSRVDSRNIKSVSECAAPLLREKSPRAINVIISCLAQVPYEERKSVAECSHSLLRGITNVNLILKIIEAVEEVESGNRKEFSRFVNLLFSRYSTLQDDEYARAAYIISLAQVNAADWESVSNCVMSLQENFKENGMIPELVETVVMMEEGRDEFPQFVGSLLEGDKSPDRKLKIIKNLATLKPKERENFAKCISELLQVDADADDDFDNDDVEPGDNEVPIDILINVEAGGREDFSKYVKSFIGGIESENIQNIIQGLAKVKVNERKHFFDCVLPFLGKIKDRELSEFITSLVELKNEERKVYSEAYLKLMSLIPNRYKRPDMIFLLNQVKSEDRKNIYECLVDITKDKTSISSEIIKELSVYLLILPVSRHQELINFFAEHAAEEEVDSENLKKSFLSIPDIGNVVYNYVLSRLSEEDDKNEPNAVWIKWYAQTVDIFVDAFEIKKDLTVYKKISEIRNRYSYSSDISFELLKNNPEKVLRSLQFKITDGRLPHIQFLDENQEPTEAIDAGGLSRQLQSTLFENLFNETARTKKLPFYNKKIADEEGVLPQVRLGQDEFGADKKAYHTLGELFAIAATDSLLTGVHFHIGLFGALSSLTRGELKVLSKRDINSWKDLPEPVLVKIFASLDPKFAFLTKSKEQRSKTEGEMFNALMTLYDEDYNERTAANLREAIENYSKDNADIPFSEIIPAIAFIAQGMFSTLDEYNWKKLVMVTPADLSAKIQGEMITLEKLMENIHWKETESAESKRTITFLKEWLIQAEQTDLNKFYESITGLKSIGKDAKKLIVNLYEPEAKESGKLPSSHTCSFALDLPVIYSSQEIFNVKMNEFLKNAFYKTGFSTM